MRRALRLATIIAIGFFSIAFLGGCGSAPQESIEQQADPQVDMSQQSTSGDDQATNLLQVAESDFPTGDSIDLNQVLYDDKGLKVTATGFGPVLYYAALTIKVENTSDQSVEIMLDSNSLNGWIWDASLVSLDNDRFDEGFALTLAPGESKDCGLGYSNTYYLAPCNISAFKQIGFVLSAYDPQSSDKLLTTPELVVNLPGREDYTQTYNDAGSEVYNQDGIRIVSKGIVENDFGESELELFIENLSNKQISLAPASIAIDGKTTDTDTHFEFVSIPAGKRALASPWIEGLSSNSKLQISLTISEIDPATYETIGDPLTTDIIDVQ